MKKKLIKPIENPFYLNSKRERVLLKDMNIEQLSVALKDISKKIDVQIELEQRYERCLQNIKKADYAIKSEKLVDYTFFNNMRKVEMNKNSLFCTIYEQIVKELAKRGIPEEIGLQMILKEASF